MRRHKTYKKSIFSWHVCPSVFKVTTIIIIIIIDLNFMFH